MHDAGFATAICPNQVTVLGLPLRPYSIGHELLLRQRSNPLLCLPWDEFLNLSPHEQTRAVRNAVWVCCNDWKSNNSEWLARFKVSLWSKRIKKANFALAIADFRNYLMEGRSLPPSPGQDASNIFGDKAENKARALGSPFLAQLYIFCTTDNFKEQRKPYRQIWDIPFSLAGYFYFTFLEVQGALKIENEKEHEAQQEIYKLEREALADAAKRKDSGEEVPAANETAAPSGLATAPPDLSGEAISPPAELLKPNELNPDLKQGDN